MGKRKRMTPNKAEKILKNIDTIDQDWFTINDLIEVFDQKYCWVWQRMANNEIKHKKNIIRGSKQQYRICNKQSIIDYLKNYLSIFT